MDEGRVVRIVCMSMSVACGVFGMIGLSGLFRFEASADANLSMATHCSPAISGQVKSSS
jgi:hypothetical protein